MTAPSVTALSPRKRRFPTLLAPYTFGPIFAYVDKWPLLVRVWGNVGGYVDLVMLVLAAFGLASRRDWLGWLLLAWIVVTVAKTFGVAPIAEAWNHVPGVAPIAFYRFAQPSWALAVIVLAARGVDALSRGEGGRRGAIVAAIGAALIAAGSGIAYGATLWPHLAPFVELRAWSGWVRRPGRWNRAASRWR